MDISSQVNSPANIDIADILNGIFTYGVHIVSDSLFKNEREYHYSYTIGHSFYDDDGETNNLEIVCFARDKETSAVMCRDASMTLRSRKYAKKDLLDGYTSLIEYTDILSYRVGVEICNDTEKSILLRRYTTILSNSELAIHDPATTRIAKILIPDFEGVLPGKREYNPDFRSMIPEELYWCQ